MGIRLYPNTKNPSILEKLACVPEGTHAMLTALEKHFNMDEEGKKSLLTHAEYSAASDKYFAALYASGNENVNKLNSFLIYGWGKFVDPAGLCPGYSGSTNQLETIQYLFTKNNIDADPRLTDGVHWC